MSSKNQLPLSEDKLTVAMGSKRALGMALLFAGIFVASPAAAEQPFEDDESEIGNVEDSHTANPPSETLQDDGRTWDEDKRPDMSVVVDEWAGGGGSAGAMLQTPITDLFPNNIMPVPKIENPVANDPEALARGKNWYNKYNCVGCHAPNGSGGMGPSLSDSAFIYGAEPENIYLSILQGRPGGMPAWGGMLPDRIIWDLVVYIQEISKDPSGGPWGTTTSADGYTTEQVPAGFMNSLHPWDHMQPFSYGQAPFEKPKGSPPLETPKK